MTLTQRFFKRIVDLFLVFIGFVVTAPIVLVTAILIKLDSRGPVLFTQERVGRGGSPFTIYKFRTMVDGAQNMGDGLVLVKGDSRITGIGHFLRRWCIDEIPQLINVLRGEMSCVGPRPTFQYQVDQYTDFQKRRLEVKPGMTGVATVKGRNKLTWPERIKWDVWYVEHYSFWLDVKVILQTFGLLARADVVEADSADAFKIRDDNQNKQDDSKSE